MDCTVSDDWGVLYIVATPIGNLRDMSPRAVEVLQQVGYIAAEDTRHSKPLLQHYGVQTATFSLHEHNEAQVTGKVVELLRQGHDVALISDAGTPLISDPGFPLVRECQRLDIRVSPIPGPSALIAALSVSGMPTDRFRFEGFLPRTRQARRQKLEGLTNESATLVFYESSHRIQYALEDLAEVLGEERTASLARELTKQYEEIRHGSLGELTELIRDQSSSRKGEFVLVVSGKPAKAASGEIPAEVTAMLRILTEELPVKQAAALAARITGIKKNRLYREALELKE